MNNAFVIEVEGDTAGIALAEGKRFRFAAADRLYWPLEGRSFAQLRQVRRAAEQTLREHRAAEARRTPPPLDWTTMLQRYAAGAANAEGEPDWDCSAAALTTKGRLDEAVPA